MPRLWGRSKRGAQLIDKTPRGHWKTSTFIAALRHDRLIAPFVIDGAVNGELFLAYVRQVLVPTLSESDIVAMDNLGSHKVARRSRRPGHMCCICQPTARTLDPLRSSSQSRCRSPRSNRF